MKLVTKKLKNLTPAPWNPRETLHPGEHEGILVVRDDHAYNQKAHQ